MPTLRRGMNWPIIVGFLFFYSIAHISARAEPMNNLGESKEAVIS